MKPLPCSFARSRRRFAVAAVAVALVLVGALCLRAPARRAPSCARSRAPTRAAPKRRCSSRSRPLARGSTRCSPTARRRRPTSPPPSAISASSTSPTSSSRPPRRRSRTPAGSSPRRGAGSISRACSPRCAAKRARAKGLLERALAMEPSNAVTLVRLGDTELELGNTAEARARFEQALAIDAQSAAALDGLGQGGGGDRRHRARDRALHARARAAAGRDQPPLLAVAGLPAHRQAGGGAVSPGASRRSDRDARRSGAAADREDRAERPSPARARPTARWRTVATTPRPTLSAAWSSSIPTTSRLGAVWRSRSTSWAIADAAVEHLEEALRRVSGDDGCSAETLACSASRSCARWRAFTCAPATTSWRSRRSSACSRSIPIVSRRAPSSATRSRAAAARPRHRRVRPHPRRRAAPRDRRWSSARPRASTPGRSSRDPRLRAGGRHRAGRARDPSALRRGARSTSVAATPPRRSARRRAGQSRSERGGRIARTSWPRRARRAIAAGRYARRAASYRQALEAAPGDRRGAARARPRARPLGRFDEAETEFTRVIAASPRSEEAWRGRVLSLLLAGKLDAAKVVLRDALQVFPRYELDGQRARSPARHRAAPPDVRDPALALDLAQPRAPGARRIRRAPRRWRPRWRRAAASPRRWRCSGRSPAARPQGPTAISRARAWRPTSGASPGDCEARQRSPCWWRPPPRSEARSTHDVSPRRSAASSASARQARRTLRIGMTLLQRELEVPARRARRRASGPASSTPSSKCALA